MDWNQIKKVVDYLIHSGEDEFVLNQINNGRLISDSHRLGKRWEREFCRACHAKGLNYRRGTANGIVDCYVNGRRVQCKAHYNLSSYKLHDITRSDVSRSTEATSNKKYRRSDLDVLALRCKDGIWLFPTDHLTDFRNRDFLRSNVVPSRFSHFRENWNVFSEVEQHSRKDCLPGIEW